MGFFARAKKRAGLLATAVTPDGICAALVLARAGDKPQVKAIVWQAAAKPSPAIALDKLNKEMQAASYRCTTLLGALDYQLLSLEAPNVPPEELKTAVGWRLKDMLDFPLAEATIDVFDIPPDQNAPVRGQSVFAVAARNSAVSQRQDMYTAAKIGLAVIDIPEMAQRNIAALLETPGRGLAMLSFDGDGGLLTVNFNAELYLSRRIDVKLAQLVEGSDDQKQQYYDKITLELQRSFDHFDRQFHFINVIKLVLAPTGADGLHGYLADNLYMPVEVLDLAAVIDVTAVPQLQEAACQARFFLTLGAAMREEAVAP